MSLRMVGCWFRAESKLKEHPMDSSVWKMLVEYWEARGWSRSEIAGKVNKFRKAQDSRTDALLSKEAWRAFSEVRPSSLN